MDYFNEIKNLIEKNEIEQRKYNYYKNESLVETYFNIGKLLVEVQGGKDRATYGNKLIKIWSVELTKLYGNGYNLSNLKYDIFCQEESTNANYTFYSNKNKNLICDCSLCNM